MSRGIIYQVGADGSLMRMHQGKPASEDHIQTLIAQHPELATGSDERLLLIRRELPIADAPDGGRRWSLDHLFVGRDARPILVEVKQASNTQLRREVIGQILEYAANAAPFWGRGKMAQAFLSRFENEDDGRQVLDAFLREDVDGDASEVANPASFWDRVEANLQAGAIKLVIVADEIPRELARIVEFLNEQMQPADVLAVELRWFSSDTGITALVPRIVGATERAAEKKLDAASRPSNEYWVKLKEAYPDLVQGKPWKDQSQDFFALRTGDPKVVIGCRFAKGSLRLHAYFDYDRAEVAYQIVKQHADEVRARFGAELEWDDMEGAKASRILYTLESAAMLDSDDWPRQHQWLNENAHKLGDALRPLLPDIEKVLAGHTPGGSVTG